MKTLIARRVKNQEHQEPSSGRLVQLKVRVRTYLEHFSP